MPILFITSLSEPITSEKDAVNDIIRWINMHISAIHTCCNKQQQVRIAEREYLLSIEDMKNTIQRNNVIRLNYAHMSHKKGEKLISKVIKKEEQLHALVQQKAAVLTEKKESFVTYVINVLDYIINKCTELNTYEIVRMSVETHEQVQLVEQMARTHKKEQKWEELYKYFLYCKK